MKLESRALCATTEPETPVKDLNDYLVNVAPCIVKSTVAFCAWINVDPLLVITDIPLKSTSRSKARGDRIRPPIY
jgi:hypothetical protein